MYCTLTNLCTLAPCTDVNTAALKPRRNKADLLLMSRLHNYKFNLDSLLSAFSFPPDITNCVSALCAHEHKISMFHDKIISSTIEAMLANISKSSNAKAERVVQG